MFTKYWRNYPRFLQIALFLLLIFTLSSFGTFILLALVPKISGVSISEIAALSKDSASKVIHASLLAQAISHISTFSLPALVFAGLTHPRIREYLGFRLPGRPIHWLLSVLLMLGLVPVFINGEAWMAQHLHFGAWADEMQTANKTTVEAFLKLTGPGSMALLLFVLAVLPAFGEELVFRGVMLRLFHKGTSDATLINTATASDTQKSMTVPIVTTALLFAAIHFNPYGFVFIFIAGCLLALIYFLTGSILCSMLAHFVYNGIQVVLVVTGGDAQLADKINSEQSLPIYYPIIGLLVFLISFILLLRTQTPLRMNWSDDFRIERSNP